MEINFKKIKPLDGDLRVGFEEFVCQLARNASNVPTGSIFQRFRGAGGDGGVECIWTLPNGEEWGWQSKYLFDLDKQQLNRSVETALKVRPKLSRYIIALPFDLTGDTARKKRGQKSQSEKFQEYKTGWEKLAKEMERRVSFELMSRSALLDEVTRIDSNGGKRLFWFDENILTSEWFNNQIRDAISEAGPRYTPQLNIKTPIADRFEAFGRTTLWKEKVIEKVSKIEELTRQWGDCLNHGDWNGKKDFPEKARQEGESLLVKLNSIKENLRKLYPDGLEPQEIDDVKKQIGEAYPSAVTCRSIAKAAVEKEHGEGKADSVGFKQFMQEYQVSFPTRHYDTACEIVDTLERNLDWLEEPIAFLPKSPAMLLIGPAGIGKTHSICDISLDRFQRGLISIVLLGHQFSDGEPWTQIKRLLGIPDNISRDQLLETLNTAGEATGFPAIIFIDAINETAPRDMWNKHLPSLIKQTARYPWVKICLSCRSTFIKDVIPDHFEIPTVEHMGFQGVEFDACFEFFSFYGIEPPSMPLLQPEYLNPLFLKLVCESLRDAGQRRLPAGILGFNHLVQLLFDTKNKKLAKILDYDTRENRVHKAMDLITQEMHNLQRPWLQWEEAKRLIESRWPSLQWSESLFNNLIKENLIKEDRTIDSDSGRIVDIISVSFERLGDHIIVSKYLSEIPNIKLLKKSFEPGGQLHFLAKDSYSVYQHKNLIEALAIQVPQKYYVELNEVLVVSPNEIKQTIINSLQWRDPGSITKNTEKFFRKPIEEGDTRSFCEVADSLLSVSTVEAHSLNSNWLHSVLSSIPMSKRDGKLSPYLHLMYSKQKNIDRLIRWGLKADLSGLSLQTTELWLTILCWFTSASDRRVRDYATKAMVRIGEAYPRAWAGIIKRFAQIDDDYIVERCLSAAYGTLLRSRNSEAAREIVQIVYEIFFENGLLRQNALIIDYARLIIELAVHLGARTDFNPQKYKPPYSGNVTIEWPEEKFIEQYKDTYWELPKLHHSCMSDDFHHYTVSGVIRKYEQEGVKLLDACRWIFKHVLDMGYAPNLNATEFDKYILSKYGGGRSRPEWAERISKKYQWIALYRLAAKLAIIYPGKSDDLKPSSAVEPLLVENMRNIDPSIIDKTSKSSKKKTWWAPLKYKFIDPLLLSDNEWLDRDDFSDNNEILMVKDNWVVLYTNYEWEHRTDESKDGYPKRIIWMQLRSFMVKKEDAERCWKWLQQQNFMGDWMPRGYELHYGFFGEYPWATPFAYIYQDNDNGFRDSRKQIPCKIVPTTNDLNIHFSFDAYQEGAISPILPSEKFFTDSKLEWNSLSGYQTNEKEKIFYDPAMEENGPYALLVNKSFLLDYLQKNNLALFWTVLSEKYFVLGDFRSGHGYTDYSRAYMLKADGKIITNKPVINRAKHDKTGM